MLPNFFVVGAQKAATTSLHNYLKNHPEIYLPEQKETKFFVDDQRYCKGISFYQQEHFSSWKGEAAVGEIDPDIMYFEYAIDRIAKHIDVSKIKFIFILRNPIDRAFSHYLMTYRRGLEPLSFEDALEKEEERIFQGYKAKMHYSYVTRGFYLRQIEKFLQYVDKTKLLILLMDDLESDRQKFLETIFKYLGVTTTFISRNIDENFHRSAVPRYMGLLHRIKEESPEKQIIRLLIPWKSLRHRLRQKLIELNETGRHQIEMKGSTRRKLSSLFERENNRLENFLGRDLSHWK